MNQENSPQKYQVCSRCVMDTSATHIVFDHKGVCNFCTEFLDNADRIVEKDVTQRKKSLDILVGQIKKDGKGKTYDCIVGVSGGLDSSWTLVQAVKLGLRPLAVHMDNGWNSELAQNNIANLVKGLDVDLYTHVIDWPEYKSLMQAFFDADVLDVELLYDNAMLAVNYQQASKYGIKYILAGTNHATEGMRMPEGWNWFKFDKRNIRALGKRFTNTKIDTFPSVGTLGYIYYEFVKKNKWISFLDYFSFNKFDTLDILEKEYGYKRYPYKHYESIFTRFYQGYILPQKFKVDKRRLHLSNLVASNQLERAEALQSLEEIPYPSEQGLADDIQYFLKKMDWTESELETYMARPGVPHQNFPSEKPLWDFALKMYRKFRRGSSGIVGSN